MSETVSALGGVRWDAGIAALEELAPQGMITLRGDLSSEPIRQVVTSVVGVDVPGHCRIEHNRGYAVAWMSPDELMLLLPRSEVHETQSKIEAALAGVHHLAVDVSETRAHFRLTGPHARDVLAKLAPVDLAAGAFEPGMIRRSRLAQAAAAFWMEDGETFRIICFRSVADYVFDLLKSAAARGSEVRHFQANSG